MRSLAAHVKIQRHARKALRNLVHNANSNQVKIEIAVGIEINIAEKKPPLSKHEIQEVAEFTEKCAVLGS